MLSKPIRTGNGFGKVSNNLAKNFREKLIKGEGFPLSFCFVPNIAKSHPPSRQDGTWRDNRPSQVS